MEQPTLDFGAQNLARTVGYIFPRAPFSIPVTESLLAG